MFLRYPKHKHFFCPRQSAADCAIWLAEEAFEAKIMQSFSLAN
jgi:hypothetical protein